MVRISILEAVTLHSNLNSMKLFNERDAEHLRELRAIYESLPFDELRDKLANIYAHVCASNETLRPVIEKHLQVLTLATKEVYK